MIRRNVLLSLFGLFAIAAVGLAQAPGGKGEKHSDKACWKCADSSLECIDACAVAMAKDPSRLACLRACVACNRECVTCARHCESGTCTPAIMGKCADACRKCLAECEKHAGHDPACKACAEDCRECIKHCEGGKK